MSVVPPTSRLSRTRRAEVRSNAERGRSATKVAYVMSRFPKLSETFVLYEILALESEGVQVELYPLLRERPRVIHEEARALSKRANYQPFLSWPIFKSQLYFLSHHPREYLETLWTVAKGTWGSLNFFVGGLVIFPKAAHAARLMANEGITHVHCHFANHPALAGLVVHRLAGIPFSFTAHGSDLHVERRMLCEKVAGASFVVAISEYNRRVMIEECDGRAAEKVRLVHCGVDTDVFRPTERLDSDGRLAMICIGTLHEVKGQRYLVEACGLLATQKVDFRCYIVGDGSDRKALSERIKRLGLDDRVVLTGPLPRNELLELLQRSDVLVAPSTPTDQGKREGIPVVLMEAMSCGLPVVTTNISGIPELVEDGKNGFLVSPGDVQGLSRALVRLHEDPELAQRLGAAGRATIERGFDLHKNATTLAQYFRGTDLE